MTQRILILGSTGSIGTQALEVMAAHPDLFELIGIAAYGSQPQLIIDQARHWGLSAHQVAVADPQAVSTVSAALGAEVISGDDAAEQLVRRSAELPSSPDTVLNALVGSMGLAATLAVLDTGARLALANKESLVAGGRLVTSKAREGQLIPVDSEHSAMAQCLRAGRTNEVKRFVLTASGGPFRGWTRERMWPVTPTQAAAHPTWSMGQMNTLNSATLVNKGLELIEATLLFDIDPDIIDVTVHPQSVIHSMVTFHDGATIAQASPPSMKMPIAHALLWPNRVPEAQPALDFFDSHTWTFEPVDNDAFPAVELARSVARHGGVMPAIYNAANEEAAAAFLNNQIKFPEIVDIVSEVCAELTHSTLGVKGNVEAAIPDLQEVLSAEAQARAQAQQRITQR
ncbi:1-deoxy-D-xylulose-5-phosphate reductoisomerase [Corynebacterium sp. 3HC-13]|uniref:1-deoxy-D-xylulose-5-phosphate reductoisomerase n=1 Tax=Corynebacterium poyangense TaxID=2684405 RepID=UPI001CCE73AD|nr:1-deoxy-D-xylulose-5-phosphate reductoisomerase [Corynebacterium poyangense]MBZ8178037.1 1-deoxy-D-xylulose-5-phosphate reductoisomerase [Corynebacterium poyangense]